MLSMVPGRRHAPVDVVSVDYVADAVCALLGEPLTSGDTHLLVSGERATTVGQLCDLGGQYFGLPVPELLDPELFEREIGPALRRDGDARTRAVLEQSAVFFPYFAVETWFDDAPTRAALAPHRIAAAALEDYFPRLVDFAVAARWGRAVPPRPEVLAGA
jgi:hypothetical protein